MIDLHCHSTFSDGSLTPEELIDAAEKIRLTALALTDHDTVAGLPRFLAAAVNRKVRAIPGIELSVDSAAGVRAAIDHLIARSAAHAKPQNPVAVDCIEPMR